MSKYNTFPKFSFFLTSSLFLFFISFSSASADSTLAGYWKFDEGSGTTANDSSANHNNGTLLGGSSFSNTQVAPITASNPYSMYFDGTSGTSVDIPDSPSLDMTTAMTAMAWVYWTGASGDNVVFDKSNMAGGDTPNYRLIVKGDGHLALWNGSAAAQSTGTITPNTWTLVNFTIDTSTTQFYINGVLSGTANIGIGATTNYDLFIGRDAIGRYFHGYIDEARLYNVALTPSQIQDISAGGAGPGVTTVTRRHHARYPTVTVYTYSNSGVSDSIRVATTTSILNTVTSSIVPSLASSTIQNIPVATTPVATTTIAISDTLSVAIPFDSKNKFTKDLYLGVSDSEVADLQKYLNNHGYKIAETGPGSLGNETGMFGLLTKKALTQFQSENNIHPSIGYFGPRTRAIINGNN